jgi:hypothetical protein
MSVNQQFKYGNSFDIPIIFVHNVHGVLLVPDFLVDILLVCEVGVFLPHFEVILIICIIVLLSLL